MMSNYGEELFKKALVEQMNVIEAHKAFRQMWDVFSDMDVMEGDQELWLNHHSDKFWYAWHALEQALCLEAYK